MVPAFAGTTAGEIVPKDKRMLAPVALLGRGGSPVFRSFCFPRIEGDGAPRRRPGCPGVAGLVIRLCPDCSELPHPSPDATAPLGAPFAASSAICLLRVSDRRASW